MKIFKKLFNENFQLLEYTSTSFKDIYEYNDKNLLILEIQKAENNIYKIMRKYDDNNNLIKYEDSDGDYELYEYDHHNNVIKQSSYCGDDNSEISICFLN